MYNQSTVGALMFSFYMRMRAPSSVYSDGGVITLPTGNVAHVTTSLNAMQIKLHRYTFTAMISLHGVRGTEE